MPEAIQREFPKAPIVGVGAVVVEGGRVLLVQRGREPLKGNWSLPGGMLEVGESLHQGVIREVGEETGLQVEPLELIELLDRIVREEGPGGERLIRFAYTTDGSARRGPVTMRARDLERLRAALERAPVLAQALESAFADARAREDP